MDRPDTLYIIYNTTEREVVSNRLGFAYIKPFEVISELHRLEKLYPHKKYELLTYERWG